MPAPDGTARRELVAKLLQFIAVSAIKIGMFTSPLVIITSAADTYNRTVQKPGEQIGDLLPLLPGVENLHVEVNGPDSVTITLQKQDIRACAEQYMEREYGPEGSAGARAGPPSPSGDESLFDHVLRLPSRNVYLKMEEELQEAEAASILRASRSLNPADVLIVADKGVAIDERLDPVFVSENKVMRGRVRTMSTSELVSAFFGKKFTSAIEPLDEAVRVTLRLVKRPEP